MDISSETRWPLTMDRALSRASCMCSGSSTPASLNHACCQANLVSSRRSKNFRLYRPRPKWKIAAPCITVLSRSKKAAARVSPATGKGGSPASAETADSSSVPEGRADFRAASAAASPASTLRAVAGRLRG